jgi:hypothetical protein
MYLQSGLLYEILENIDEEYFNNETGNENINILEVFNMIEVFLIK